MKKLQIIPQQEGVLYEKHFLFPSTFYIGKKPSHITTVLGTCVAVCLWDSKIKIGAMNHYMLPLWNGDGLASPKYGNIAINKMIDKMINMGSNKNNLKAKIFGGKSETDGKLNHYRIGDRNAEIAISMLEEEGIAVIAKNLGGAFARKLQFFTDTGDVYMSLLNVLNFKEENQQS